VGKVGLRVLKREGGREVGWGEVVGLRRWWRGGAGEWGFWVEVEGGRGGLIVQD